MVNIIKGKCPKCKKGNIFKHNGNLFLLKTPLMHERCTECNYKFAKESGYFIGALYISYALTVIEMLFIFFGTMNFLPVNAILGVILIALLAFSFFNFRYARIIWIWIFQY